jgi:hypothetical protein
MTIVLSLICVASLVAYIQLGALIRKLDTAEAIKARANV